MGKKTQRGFTIIELSLFFAISGLLLATLLTGIGLSIQNQRFTDAANGLQSFLQQQYNETQITINGRETSDCGGAPRGSSECLVIGKVIDLGKSDSSVEDVMIKSYPVIIDQAAADSALNAKTPPSEIDLLNNQPSDPEDGSSPKAETRVVKSDRNDQSYPIPWGANLNTIEDSSGHQTPSGAAAELRYLLIIRSPITGVISTYKLDISKDEELFDASDSYVIADHIRIFGGSDNQSVKGCIVSADLSETKALLKIAPGSTQDSITTQFDTVEKGSWCND